MEVLVPETEPNVAHEVVEELNDRGYGVSRCHEPGRPAFPCRALEGLGPCPLAEPGTDVALTVRADPGTRPSLREDGVACALRARSGPSRSGGTRHAQPLRRVVCRRCRGRRCRQRVRARRCCAVSHSHGGCPARAAGGASAPRRIRRRRRCRCPAESARAPGADRRRRGTRSLRPRAGRGRRRDGPARI